MSQLLRNFSKSSTILDNVKSCVALQCYYWPAVQDWLCLRFFWKVPTGKLIESVIPICCLQQGDMEGISTGGDKAYIETKSVPKTFQATPISPVLTSLQLGICCDEDGREPQLQHEQQSLPSVMQQPWMQDNPSLTVIWLKGLPSDTPPNAARGR